MGVTNEFSISRVLDAPRALVFQMWTDPVHLAAWWGPHGITNRVESDLRAGGAYRIVMNVDGNDYPLTGFYKEVTPPSKLVYTNDLSQHPALEGAGSRAVSSITTVTLEELAPSQTKMTVHMRFELAADRDASLKVGMVDGWIASFDRLEADMFADRVIGTTRDFDAPRELVWKMYTDPEHVVHWWGPDGFRTTIASMDVRPGGIWDFVMHGPDGTDYKNLVTYIEVTPPKRLVYDHGPGPRFRSVISFTELGPTRTRVFMNIRLESAKIREQVAHYAVPGMHQTLGRLGERLAKLQLTMRE